MNAEGYKNHFLYIKFFEIIFLYNAEDMRYHLSKKVIRWEEIAYYFVHCVSRKCHVQNVSGFVINIYTDAAKGSRNCCICKVYSEYITMEMRLEKEVNIWGPEIYVHYYIKVRHKCMASLCTRCLLRRHLINVAIWL